MTREVAQQQKAKLEVRREALVDQLTVVDASQATLSSGSGSKSFSNRSVAEIKAKIRFCDREIARLDAVLGNRPAPGGIKTIYARFDG